MTNIHWLGAGLSSIPGIRRIASNKNNITVWNRTLQKAQNSINHVNLPSAKAKKLDFQLLENEIKKGDIIVSQLSANMHFDVAKLCLKTNSHFATTSYLSEDLKKLNDEAKLKNLVFINEIGLDPGIDHLFTHLLVNELKQQKLSDISITYKS